MAVDPQMFEMLSVMFGPETAAEIGELALREIEAQEQIASGVREGLLAVPENADQVWVDAVARVLHEQADLVESRSAA